MVMQDLSGRKLGAYELRERFGRGGMAEVYKAYQTSMERFVAVKVMLGNLNDDEEFIERFRREARAVGKLRHGHIVQIFDFGVEDGIYYMVMELISGGNLKELLNKRGKLSPHHALTITSQLASALDYAHKAGMIHRDLKPANVMFTDDAGKNAILTDFGIARILGASGLTGTGMAVGTPTYMSPEAGAGDNIDERADIYALGIMLYEMLTGNVPYDADTPLAVVMKHINAPLPTRDLYGELIPEPIEGIILKAMSKKPEDRYATAEAMKAAVDNALRFYSEEDGVAGSSGIPVESLPTEKVNREKPTTIAPVLPDHDTQAVPIETPTQTTRKPPIGILVSIAAALLVMSAVGVLLSGILRDSGSTDDPPPTASVQGNEQNNDSANSPEVRTGIWQLGNLNPDGLVMPPDERNLKLTTGISPLLNRVDVMYLNGEAERAFEELNEVLAEEPNNPQALFARSQLYSTSYDEEQLARQDAEKLIEIAPDSIYGYIALSDSYLVYPDYAPEEARSAIERAYEIDPLNPHVLWRYGRLANWEQQAELVDEAETAGAGGYRFIQFMGYYLYNDVEDSNRAIPYLAQQLNVPNRDVASYEAVTMMMGALMETDRVAAAMRIAERIAENDPEPAQLADIAFVAYYDEDYEQAQEWSQLAIALDPERYDALWIRGLLLADPEDDPFAAEAQLTALEDIEFYPNYLTERFWHTLNYDRAEIFFWAEEYERALEYYTREIDENGWYVAPFLGRARTHYTLGNLEAAIEDLRAARNITDDPDLIANITERLLDITEEAEADS